MASRRNKGHFPQFPRGNKAGASLVILMGLCVFLASGAPGIARGDNAPSKNWIEFNAVPLDAIKTPFLLKAQELREDRELVRSILQSKRHREQERLRNRPLKQIDYRILARKAAIEAGIKRPNLFVRQIAAESGMQPCVVSPAGAIGIAQIMPNTAKGWRVDPWIPEDALRAAARAMARYERQLGSYRLALAAYNAGPGAVQRHRGVPPYAETQEYIRRVMTPDYELRGMSQLFVIPQRMTPTFAGRLRKLTAAVRAQGGTLELEEGWRSYEESLRIWKATKRKYGGWDKAKRWAAPPGCSNHVRGQAADLKGDLKLAQRLAPRYGLIFPMAHEPWHVEQAGIRTQSG